MLVLCWCYAGVCYAGVMCYAATGLWPPKVVNASNARDEEAAGLRWVELGGIRLGGGVGTARLEEASTRSQYEKRREYCVGVKVDSV